MVTTPNVSSAAGGQWPEQDPPRQLVWKDSQLVIHGRAPFPEFGVIVQLINTKQFDAALEAIQKIDQLHPARDQALLAMAVAGHPDSVDTGEPLKIARQALAAATRDDEVIESLRLLNEVELFQILPNKGLVTSPYLLPARDMIRRGDLAGGRGRGRAAERRSVKEYVFVTWCLAGIFEGQEPFEILLADAEKAIDAWDAAKGNLDKRIPVFKRLLKQARQHEWATLTVPADSVLYPKGAAGMDAGLLLVVEADGRATAPHVEAGLL